MHVHVCMNVCMYVVCICMCTSMMFVCMYMYVYVCVLFQYKTYYSSYTKIRNILSKYPEGMVTFLVIIT